jgi:flagellar basal-body rod protein FlgB
MFIRDVIESGAIPALEAGMRFAARRQELLAHNIANIETPEFIPLDASPRAFQEALGQAIRGRRERTGGEFGDLKVAGNKELEWDGLRRLRLRARTPSGHILFHDRNNRDIEHLMKDLVENTGAFRVATDLLRQRYRLLTDAMAERVG